MSDLTIDNLNLGEEFQEAVENALPISEGRYLAIVTGVELKVKESTGSVGYAWKLSINTNNEDLSTWDTTAKTLKHSHYTFLGKLGPGGDSVVYGEKGPGFGAVKMLRALQQGAQLNKTDVIGRQILVTMGAEADWSQTQAGISEENADKILAVKDVRVFIEDGVKGPKLPAFENLTQAVEEDTEEPSF